MRRSWAGRHIEVGAVATQEPGNVDVHFFTFQVGLSPTKDEGDIGGFSHGFHGFGE